MSRGLCLSVVADSRLPCAGRACGVPHLEGHVLEVARDFGAKERKVRSENFHREQVRSIEDFLGQMVLNSEICNTMEG